MMEWIKRWLRRFLGYCPNCGKVTSRSTATQGAVPYETEGTKWTCNACGWYRIWWEDDSAEEKWPGEDVKRRMVKPIIPG